MIIKRKTGRKKGERAPITIVIIDNLFPNGNSKQKTTSLSLKTHLSNEEVRKYLIEYIEGDKNGETIEKRS